MRIVRNQRNSSIELLRIVSMLLIIMFHYLCREYRLYVVSNELLVQSCIQSKLILRSLGALGVPIFIFISGHYGLRFRKVRLIDMVLQGFLYMLISFIGLYYVEHIFYWKQMFNFLNEWWFLQAYIILYLLSPGIEWMFENLSSKKMLLVTSLSCLMAFCASYPGNLGGSGLLDMVSMYLLARCISLYLSNSLKHRAVYWLFGLLGLRMSLIILSIRTNHLGFITLIDCYTNPLSVIIAASIFYTFNYYSFSSKSINWLSASALSVYLLSESDFGKVFFLPLFGVECFSIIRFVLAACIVYVSIVLIDNIRKPISNLILKRYSK